MSAPAAKRQRNEEASAALSRPFRSPFKQPSIPEQTPAQTASPGRITTATRRPSQSSIANTATTPSKSPLSKPFVSPSTDTATSATARETKEQRGEEQTLQDLRLEVDMLEQARTIELSGEDEELERLIAIWRSVSREAADYMFSAVRERVERMGGVAAWCETQRKISAAHMAGENDELPKADNDNDEARLAIENRTSRVEEDGEYRGHVDTMEKMLRSLNIDLDIIGYDQVAQRWREE